MKFAHFSDIHLGFHKAASLQRIEQKIFEDAIDDCMRRSVDFILICGDMFHRAIPEMRVQKFVFAKLRQTYEAGIPVYVVFGSHDFSPTSVSVIDLLVETGYIKTVQVPHSNDDGTISLDFVSDAKTGVKLAGLSGLAVGKDIKYYENLRRAELESEPGFKIFLFHGAVSEMRTADDAAQTAEASMPLSYMPRGFDYYAGGHIHRYQRYKSEGYGEVVYSGTPFAGFHSDLDENAKGTVRGYVLVEFDTSKGGGISDVRQIPLEGCKYAAVSVDARHKRSGDVRSEIAKNVDDLSPEGKIVILTAHGKMSDGKTTDIDFGKMTDDLLSKGAIDVQVHNNRLASAEYEVDKSWGETAEEIISNTFEQNIAQVKSEFDELKGQKGRDLAEQLLEILRKPPLANESLVVYNGRITDEAMATLGLSEDAVAVADKVHPSGVISQQQQQQQNKEEEPA